jgi:ubiquinone/menaquinone biosynthesis C-methylase UbiE
MDDLQIKQTLAGIYDAIAPTYERAAVPVFRPIAKRMLQLIDLRPGWQVLDAGAGTGLIALMGAPRVGKTGKMVGVDASEKMLDIARHKAAQFGFTQCDFRVGDIQALEVGDAQFNAVLSQFAIHHTDASKSLREFHRVMMPGGTLVLHEWAAAPNGPNKTAFDILSKYRAAEANGALAIVRAQSERAYRFRVSGATPDLMTELAKTAGFSIVEARLESHSTQVPTVDAIMDFLTAAPLMSVELSNLSDATRMAFLDETREALQIFRIANGYQWTQSVLAVVAHKSATS